MNKIEDNTLRTITRGCRPGGTGQGGPAMAGPTFELSRSFFKHFVNFLKSKMYTTRRYLLIRKLRQWHSTYALGIATLDLEILFHQRQEAKELQLAFENQLDKSIQFADKNIQFHRKFRFIFRKFSLRMHQTNVHFREAKPQKFPG